MKCGYQILFFIFNPLPDDFFSKDFCKLTYYGFSATTQPPSLIRGSGEFNAIYNKNSLSLRFVKLKWKIGQWANVDVLLLASQELTLYGPTILSHHSTAIWTLLATLTENDGVYVNILAICWLEWELLWGWLYGFTLHPGQYGAKINTMLGCAAGGSITLAIAIEPRKSTKLPLENRFYLLPSFQFLPCWYPFSLVCICMC